MKILVCGGRTYNDYTTLSETLDTLHSLVPITWVIHGDAAGADRLSGDWAFANSIPQQKYPADWDKHGRAAGPIRNTKMLSDNPDIELVVSFPGGIGTANMLKQARAKGIKIKSVG